MTTWDIFFNEKCIEIFNTCPKVLDIGEGLRARTESGNKFDSKRAWLQEYIKKVDYVVMDPVPDYKPDIVGDIHAIPLPDASVDGIFCLAVLEHVQNPIKAVEEMYRILKPGGKILIYVPFLYYYHAHKGYYKDYWRFTFDTLTMFAQPASQHEIMPVRRPIETLVRLTPFGTGRFSSVVVRFFDKILYGSKNSKQVSGYHLFITK